MHGFWRKYPVSWCCMFWTRQHAERVRHACLILQRTSFSSDDLLFPFPMSHPLLSYTADTTKSSFFVPFILNPSLPSVRLVPLSVFAFSSSFSWSSTNGLHKHPIESRPFRYTKMHDHCGDDRAHLRCPWPRPSRSDHVQAYCRTTWTIWKISRNVSNLPSRFTNWETSIIKKIVAVDCPSDCVHCSLVRRLSERQVQDSLGWCVRHPAIIHIDLKSRTNLKATVIKIAGERVVVIVKIFHFNIRAIILPNLRININRIIRVRSCINKGNWPKTRRWKKHQKL